MEHSSLREKVKRMTSEELKRRAESLDFVINGEYACFGSRDVTEFYMVLEELEKRGFTVLRRLVVEEHGEEQDEASSEQGLKRYRVTFHYSVEVDAESEEDAELDATEIFLDLVNLCDLPDEIRVKVERIQ